QLNVTMPPAVSAPASADSVHDPASPLPTTAVGALTSASWIGAVQMGAGGAIAPSPDAASPDAPSVDEPLRSSPPPPSEPLPDEPQAAIHSASASVGRMRRL